MHTAERASGWGILTFIGVLIVLVADSVIDLKGLSAQNSNIMWSWLLAPIITAAMLYGFPIVAKALGIQIDIAGPAEMEERYIEPSILRRWNMVWDESEIDPDEPRAEITCFPTVLMQIEEAEAARLGCSDRTVRVALGERVLILMRETLGPLAAELEYLRQAEQPQIDDLHMPTFQQLTKDAEAQLLASAPI